MMFLHMLPWLGLSMCQKCKHHVDSIHEGCFMQVSNIFSGTRKYISGVPPAAQDMCLYSLTPAKAGNSSTVCCLSMYTLSCTYTAPLRDLLCVPVSLRRQRAMSHQSDDLTRAKRKILSQWRRGGNFDPCLIFFILVKPII